MVDKWIQNGVNDLGLIWEKASKSNVTWKIFFLPKKKKKENTSFFIYLVDLGEWGGQ